MRARIAASLSSLVMVMVSLLYHGVLNLETFVWTHDSQCTWCPTRLWVDLALVLLEVSHFQQERQSTNCESVLLRLYAMFQAKSIFCSWYVWLGEARCSHTLLE